MTVDIIHADAREALAAMTEGSVHTCITSPPYWGLRDYGIGPDAIGLEPTPELYVEHIVQVMREVRRVLRDNATLWLNLGDSYASGKGTCYNPGGGESSLGQERKAAGVHPLDRDNKSTLSESGLKPKDLVGIPWRVAFALQADGWWLRSDIVWSKPNPMPESVTDRPTRSHEYLFLLTKSARYYYDQDAIRESLTASSIARISQPTFDQQTGGPKDYGHRTNANRSARKALCNLKEKHIRQEKWGDRHEGWKQRDRTLGRNKRSVWEIPAQPYPGAHFAVFPEKLVEPCILAGTSEWGCCPECGAPWERVVEKTAVPHDAEAKYPVGAGERMGKARDALRARGNSHDNPFEPVRTTGWRPTCDHDAEPVPCTVMDPFAGSGTVGLVAERLGRHSVLIDANESYCEMARERTAQMGLMV